MKIESPEFKSIFTEELRRLSSIFLKHKFEVKLAGGAVRDILLGHRPHDLDFATTATPVQMKNMFDEEGIPMINNRGEKHGTITARINDKENYEVTTLRIDKVTDGRHAEVEFVTDWALDAGRRDLTINAMFLDLNGNLVDYFGGFEDLRECHIKFVGDPVQRIQEDFLRILRYYRFYGRFAHCENSHDLETIKAIQDNAEGLEAISGERLWVECRKILSGRFNIQLVHRIIEDGVAVYLGFPKSPNVKEFEIITTRSENNSLDLHPITLVASLMNHTTDVENFHKRLKVSAFERDLAMFLIENREDTLDVNPLRRYKKLTIKSKKPPKDEKIYIEELIKYKGQTSVLKEFLEWEPPKFPVKGGVLKENGVPGGRMMSVVIDKLKDKWIDTDCNISAEDLAKMIPAILEESKKKDVIIDLRLL
ncbi:CCA tRNA nucleotidyltransferase 1, mitochondrial-like [Artemia franciscana]|uniref:Uncharacterized protein n=1 Tax=Artemia franciscana TaxID=6661 RepID=A0AA88H9X7_ARTSF|nr:hypothetical protein QYM36_017081 [Artemia franciscana]